ncbi:efflux RND transporter permease subunit [Algiphilus sp. W345]|uniref:Efflux RND transporter permease subunit n=1 Tax=Banduia mediterranea TaxID=3075609 RepID=A0ABU2WEB1_9GAMM|nr:efflux RND transporter permease subunit [Algiphilus sp. W345]MDT0496207.1 efflux RND transporter permease subunit [Algiphilus sp. W345]
MHGEVKGGFAKWYVDVTVPIIFHKRARLLIVLTLATLFLGWQATQLRLDAGFEKQLPLGHPYIEVFKEYQREFGGANLVLFAVMQKEGNGDIYEPAFMDTLRKATDAMFFLPGMDRSRVSSIMTPDVRYLEVVEEGFRGGNVVPADFTPTPEMLEGVRRNVEKAGVVGRLVANDERGAMIFGELLERDPVTDEKLDYFETADRLEQIRQRFTSPKMWELRLKSDLPPLEAGEVVKTTYSDPRGLLFDFSDVDVQYKDESGNVATTELSGRDLAVSEIDNPDYNESVDIHIIGFAKIVGDIGDKAAEVVGFFGLTILLVWIVLWMYTGSWLVAFLPLSCGLLAVVWELGMLHLFGYGLDPFAILVPFLVIAISVSHGIQITNFWLLEAANKRLNSYDAAMGTYKRLVIPGLTALVTNFIGFGTLLLIPIGIVQEMAINACFGLFAVVICKKVLLPCLLSFVPIRNPEKFQRHQLRRDAALQPLWRVASYMVLKRQAAVVLAATALAWGVSEYINRDLAIGELHQGTPELRPDSRYNLDTDAIVSNFTIGVDVLKIIAEGSADGCIDYSVVSMIDRLAWRMENTPGVQSTLSLPHMQKMVFNAYNENNPAWNVLPREPGALVVTVQPFPSSTGLLNTDCSAMPLFVFTADHKAETIDSVIESFEAFVAEMPEDSPVTFKLATGNVGVMAAANDVVEETEFTVLLWLFVAIAVSLWVSFRSLVSVICILAPLAAVSVFTYSVMVFLEIGVKVSNIATVAFAAGIGVDYGIYIYSVLEENVKEHGMAMREAYTDALGQTGKAVVFTALALSASVATWMLSGLQFQVDMGILMTVMFIANAVAAIFIMPSFAAFLLRGPREGKKQVSEPATSSQA